MRDSIRLVLAVIVTCVIASTGLAATYAMAEPRIREQERLAEERSLKSVLAEAESFEAITDPDVLDAATAAAADGTNAPVLSGIYVATSGGAPAGWGLKIASRGYGGPMSLVIGLDRDGTVTGVSILRHNETPGLGTKVITDTWFMEQFPTLPPAFDDADVRTLDVIAGTTKSSNGVRNGVAAAGRVFAEVLSEEGGAQ
jgi:electron transport complex protein RnfG